MSKEKNRGNKEAKKPKKEKTKVLATANSNTGKETVIGGKSVSGGPSGKPAGRPGGKSA